LKIDGKDGKYRKDSGEVKVKILGRLFLTVILLGALGLSAFAQSARRQKPAPTPPPPSREELKKIADQAAESRATLVAASKTYQESLERLLELQRAEVTRLKELHEKRRQMLEEGIIAKRELDESELKLAEATKKADETTLQIETSEQLVAEVEAAEELAKKQPTPADQVFSPTLKYIRYTGTANFSLLDHIKIGEYFLGQFGRTLPISALGQTTVHDRLGFDHRRALDVAIHPDSKEGQTLMTYLRTQGIPFMAFRGAIPGSATGAHIHIGPPSHRVSP
jgi:hypothetical protein